MANAFFLTLSNTNQKIVQRTGGWWRQELVWGTWGLEYLWKFKILTILPAEDQLIPRRRVFLMGSMATDGSARSWARGLWRSEFNGQSDAFRSRSTRRPTHSRDINNNGKPESVWVDLSFQLYGSNAYSPHPLYLLSVKDSFWVFVSVFSLWYFFPEDVRGAVVKLSVHVCPCCFSAGLPLLT